MAGVAFLLFGEEVARTTNSYPMATAYATSATPKSDPTRIIRASARLGDLWLFGVQRLSGYKEVTEVAQELAHLRSAIEPYREWNQDLDLSSFDDSWIRLLPGHGEMVPEKRSEWGYLILGPSPLWQCSKDRFYAMKSYEDIAFKDNESRTGTVEERMKLMNERQRRAKIEYARRLAEYHVQCFDELEIEIRKHVEQEDQEAVFTIRDFAQVLLQSQEVKFSSDAVASRINARLTDELSVNRYLATLEIQLKVAEGATLEEIGEEAKEVRTNINIARDWLDEATKERHEWVKGPDI